MIHKIKLFLSFCMICTMLLGSTSFIYGEETGEYTEDTTTETEIGLSIPSTFSVKIPKKITLNGTTKVGTYKVFVKGDIAGNREVVVEPEEEIVLTQFGKADGSATVIQDQTGWMYTDINDTEYTEAEGIITASNISAGLWKSKLNFYIGLDEKRVPGLYAEDGTMTYTWDELVDNGYITVDANKTVSLPHSAKDVLIGTVVIPEGIVSASAAWTISLSRIELPSTLTANLVAPFAYGSLKEIVVHKKNPSYKTVNGMLLSKDGTQLIQSPSLKEGIVTVPDGVTNIRKQAFAGSMYVTELILPEGLQYIQEKAFTEMLALKTINIPSTVTELSLDVFKTCSSLETITLPASITKISRNPFKECPSLREILIDDANPAFKSVDGVVFSKDGTSIKIYPGGKTETEYTIPDTVTTIMNESFQSVKLNKVTIPASVTKVENCVFHESPNLTTIVYDGTEYTNTADLEAALTAAGVTVTTPIWNK